MSSFRLQAITRVCMNTHTMGKRDPAGRIRSADPNLGSLQACLSNFIQFPPRPTGVVRKTGAEGTHHEDPFGLVSVGMVWARPPQVLWGFVLASLEVKGLEMGMIGP